MNYKITVPVLPNSEKQWHVQHTIHATSEETKESGDLSKCEEAEDVRMRKNYPASPDTEKLIQHAGESGFQKGQNFHETQMAYTDAREFPWNFHGGLA